MGIDASKGIRRSQDFRRSDIRGSENRLTLQVGSLDIVIINKNDCSDTRRRQILYCGRANAAGTHNGNTCFGQPQLPCAPKFAENDVTRVALEFVVRKRHWKRRVVIGR